MTPRHPRDRRSGPIPITQYPWQDPDFRTWWAGHHVASLTVGTKSFNHPVAGELALTWDTLTASTDPEQKLVVWTAEVGSAAHDGLRILASWAADQYVPASSAVR